MKKLFATILLAFLTAQVFATFTAFPPQTSGTSTLDIQQAQFYGSVSWANTASCEWSNSTTGAWNNFGVDADCDDNARTIRGVYNSTNGDAGNSDGQLPKVVFSYIPAGILRCEAKGFFYGNTSASTYGYRFSDGTNATSSQIVYGTGGIEASPVLIGEFNYTTPQTSSTTIQIQSYPSAGLAGIAANGASRALEISCYHYPAPQKVVAASCSGLECEGFMSARVASDGTVTSESVDFINGNCSEGSTGVYTCTYNSSLFGVEPSVICTVDQTSAFADRTCTTDSGSTSSFVIRTVNSAGIAESNAFHVNVSRQGSDYKQFDSRFIPVTDNETQTLEYAEGQSSHQDRSGEIRFSTGLTTNNFTGKQWLEVQDDAGNTRTKFTNTSGSTVVTDIHYFAGITTASYFPSVYKNGIAGYCNGSAIYTSGVGATVSCQLELAPNDYITIGVNGDSVVNTGFVATLSLSTRPKSQKAFIGNLTPKEFVQTPGSTKPVMYSATITSACAQSSDVGSFVASCSEVSTGIYELTPESSKFSDLNCTVSAINTNENITCRMHAKPSTSLIKYNCRNHATPANVSTDAMLTCHGVQ